jgi:hypothetical protein
VFSRHASGVVCRSSAEKGTLNGGSGSFYVPQKSQVKDDLASVQL